MINLEINGALFDFRIPRISFWSFRTHILVISYPVTNISYPGHLGITFVILYLVLYLNGYEVTLSKQFPTQVISYCHVVFAFHTQF